MAAVKAHNSIMYSISILKQPDPKEPFMDSYINNHETRCSQHHSEVDIDAPNILVDVDSSALVTENPLNNNGKPLTTTSPSILILLASNGTYPQEMRIILFLTADASQS